MSTALPRSPFSRERLCGTGRQADQRCDPRNERAFVNELSERARRDIVRFATAEVTEAERRAESAAVALAEFARRNR